MCAVALARTPRPHELVLDNSRLDEMDLRLDAGEDTSYVDFHDRRWHLRTWTLSDQDVALVSVARELSDGYVVLTRTMPTALGDAAVMQLNRQPHPGPAVHAKSAQPDVIAFAALPLKGPPAPGHWCNASCPLVAYLLLRRSREASAADPDIDTHR